MGQTGYRGSSMQRNNGQTQNAFYRNVSTMQLQENQNLQIGEMDPEKSNQIPYSSNYYNNRQIGMIYQNKDADKQTDYNYGGLYMNRNEEPTGRPVKRLYINFDKDIAQRMFGYRVHFQKNDMKSYVGEGMPSVYAP